MNLNETPLLFQFETASSDNLKFMPMIVRFHLDQLGLRISFAQWQALSYDDRRLLARFPADGNAQTTADFGRALTTMLHTHAQAEAEPFAPEASPAWQGVTAVPDDVLRQTQLAHLVAPSVTQWAKLAPFQRYVLCKLSRKPEVHRDFVPAMHEFGLSQ